MSILKLLWAWLKFDSTSQSTFKCAEIIWTHSCSKSTASKSKPNATKAMIEQVLIIVIFRRLPLRWESVVTKSLNALCTMHWKLKSYRVVLTSRMKRSVGAETEGEGSPRRRTDPIIRESAKDFILFLFKSKSYISDWWSSCKCAHEHWHLRLRPRFYIPIHHYAAPNASFIEWWPTPSYWLAAQY